MLKKQVGKFYNMGYDTVVGIFNKHIYVKYNKNIK